METEDRVLKTENAPPAGGANSEGPLEEVVVRFRGSRRQRARKPSSRSSPLQWAGVGAGLRGLEQQPTSRRWWIASCPSSNDPLLCGPMVAIGIGGVNPYLGNRSATACHSTRFRGIPSRTRNICLGACRRRFTVRGSPLPPCRAMKRARASMARALFIDF